MFKQLLLLSAVAACVVCKPYATSYASMTQFHKHHDSHDNDKVVAVPHYPLFASVDDDYNDNTVYQYNALDDDHQNYYDHRQYTFKYGVDDQHTYDVKSQEEHRHGNVVKGHYKLVQPDGRIRVVYYTADKHNGFNAHVQYLGQAAHHKY